MDMRNLDALVGLFVDDIGVPGKQRGRQALKRWYADQLRSLKGSAHGVLGHVIDIHSPDLASGLVYSRNDLETDDVFLIEMMAYLDRYERRDGRWYFQRRTPLFWYECDITDPPVGPNKLRWPGRAKVEGAFHAAFPSFERYQSHPDIGDRPLTDEFPPDDFIDLLREGAAIPRVNPGGGSALPPA